MCHRPDTGGKWSPWDVSTKYLKEELDFLGGNPIWWEPSELWTCCQWGRGLGQFPAEVKSRVPAPSWTILEQTNLSGCISWSLEAADLLSGFANMFSWHDMDLGETLVVKHEIKLQLNSWSFHDRYCPIPKSMYEEVRKHPRDVGSRGDQTPIKSMGLGGDSGLEKGWKTSVLYWLI